MPIGHAKLIEILREELKKAPSRYDGYIKEVEKEVVEILNLEAQHAISQIDILVRINEKCQKLGQLLTEHEITDQK